jgi:hypothetical protein
MVCPDRTALIDSGASEPPGMSLATAAGRLADSESASWEKSATPAPVMVSADGPAPLTVALKLKLTVVAGLTACPVAALEAPVVATRPTVVLRPTAPTTPSVASHLDDSRTFNLPVLRSTLASPRQ